MQRRIRWDAEWINSENYMNYLMAWECLVVVRIVVLVPGHSHHNIFKKNGNRGMCHDVSRSQNNFCKRAIVQIYHQITVLRSVVMIQKKALRNPDL